MKVRLHHVCIGVADYDWYLHFFAEVMGMTVERKKGEAPKRQLWFNEGIQLKELEATETQGSAVDHISIGAEDIPAMVEAAIAHGCSPLPNGEHWFALPDGTKIELKPY